jgi:type IV pilus assembly protein PilB
VQVVEMETQSSIEGVRHNVFDPQKDGSEYSTLVRSILRRDPDVVGIAEVDEETAKEISRADTEHTRVYVTLKADDPLKAVQLFAQMVGDQKKAAACLHGVVAVKLARRLCHNCKVAVQPTPENLKKLGLPPDTKQLFRKSGKVLVKDKEQMCPVCNGVGYFGQIGVFAVHTFGDEERQRVAQNDLTGLRAALRQKKQQSIQQAALQHVLKGETSVEEVLRITSSQKQKKGGSGEKTRSGEAAA